MVVIVMLKCYVTDQITDQMDFTHRYDRDIVVDEDVWMGINVILLNGVHVGRGCIIGAGCVVSKSTPLFCCCGQPV